MRHFLVCLGMALDFIDSLYDDLPFPGQGFQDFAFFPFVFAGKYDYCVAFFNVQLNDFSQRRHPSRLKYFRGQRDDLHKIFLTKFSRDRSKNAGSFGALIILDDNCGIFVKTDM